MEEYLNSISHDEYLFKVDLFVHSAWIGHAPFLKFLIRDLRPNNYVELGVHNGFSFFLACQSFVENNIIGKTYAVDHWEGDGHVGQFGAEIFEEVKINNARYKEFAELIKKDFNKAVKEFENNSIDVLHIDGFHSYESVKADFENWLPKMSNHGVVLLHDISVRRNGFGVYKLWGEIKQKYRYLEFVGSHGLGVVFLGDIQGRNLKDLYNFSLKENGMAIIQGVFGSISDDVIQSSTNAIYKGVALQRDSAVAERDSAVAERDSAVAERDSAVAERDSIKQSFTWRVFLPYRKAKNLFRRI